MFLKNVTLLFVHAVFILLNEAVEMEGYIKLFLREETFGLKSKNGSLTG